MITISIRIEQYGAYYKYRDVQCKREVGTDTHTLTKIDTRGRTY